MPTVNFFEEDVSFKLNQKTKIKSWIKKVVQEEGAQLNELNFIFCSDSYLKEVNVSYLDHDYFTDIITFDNSEEEGVLEGDVFISTDRVSENSQHFSTTFDLELRRVIIHGVLHLIGYKDKTDDEQLLMRQKEDLYVSLYSQMNQS